MTDDDNALMVMFDRLLNYPHEEGREHVIEWERLEPRMAEVVRAAIAQGLLREQVVISRLTVTEAGAGKYERLLVGPHAP